MNMSKNVFKSAFISAVLIPRKILMRLIRWYQVTFSPDHSPSGKSKYPFGYCRFTPSCSEYSYRAISKYGVFVGGALSLWRILRCNPWGKGGYDEP